jgi:branched-chain amino acid transport system permease protein
MSEMSQALPSAKPARIGWFEFAMRYRASLASLLLLIFPLVMPFTALAVNILVYGLYAVGFNLVFGYLGLLSFGHAALFGTGAYMCGIAITHFGLPWYAAIVVGILSGAAMAAIIGSLAIRTRGIYFAMVTMALAECVYYLFIRRWIGPVAKTGCAESMCAK